MGWLLLLVVLVGAMGLLIAGDATLFGLDWPDLAAAGFICAFLIVITLSLAGSYRGRTLHAARDFLAWAAIALALVAGYSFRDEITQIAFRVRGELLPPGDAVSIETTTPGSQAVRIRKRRDGHFIANAKVNGQPMSLLVDTGASTVVLREADAVRLGVDTRRLTYTVPVQTANGITYAAHVRLTSIAVGTIQIQGVDALVAKPGALRENLLGMTFLSRLRSYEFSGEFLTLRT
jgi:aspartyl protease family protein